MKLNQYTLTLFFHVLFIGPVILAYALLDKKSPKFLRNMTIALALLAILYHGYQIIKMNFISEKFSGNLQLSNDRQYYIDSKNKKRINRTCPHNGCNVDYNQEENKFVCPCHNSQFKRNGEYVKGSCQDTSWQGDNLSVSNL